VSEALKATVYFGEGDRHGGALVSDGLAGLAERRGLRVAVLLRGAEGFGLTQVVRTQRLLTMSENTPLVWTAIDRPEPLRAALDEVVELAGAGGLVTLERARLGARPADLSLRGDGACKLTLYPGRRARAGDRPAVPALVDLLRDAGMEGASALLGLDGTLGGERHRARFFSRNAGVPLMVIAAGSAEATGRAIERLDALERPPPCTLERIRVLKRDGVPIDRPRLVPEADVQGLGFWQKVMVHSRQRDRSGGRPLHLELVRRLRRAGASGATVLRGAWGYRGADPPAGDGLVALGHRGPLVTVLVDRPAATRRWWPALDEVTARAGLVTGEIVPAFRATAPGAVVGGLRLAAAEGIAEWPGPA